MAAVGVVLLLALSLTGCQRAKLGARCKTKDWGDDGKAWILQCTKGRWVHYMTKAQALALLAAHQRQLAAGGDSLAASPPDNPARGVGSTRTDPIAVLTDASIGGQFWARVESPYPVIITPGHSHPGSTATPAAGQAFVGVGVSLMCGNGSERPCTDGNRAAVHIRLVGSNGVEYASSAAPGFTPDVLTTTSQMGTPLRSVGWSAFVVPAGSVDGIEMKVWVDGSSISPTYMRIR